MPGDQIPHSVLPLTESGQLNTMTLLNIANKVIGCDTIGGAPVYGVTAQWFVDQFMELVRLDPTAAQLDDHKIYCAMCSLYLLDPQDLVWVSPFDPDFD
jgi:hypothetical protein